MDQRGLKDNKALNDIWGCCQVGGYVLWGIKIKSTLLSDLPCLANRAMLSSQFGIRFSALNFFRLSESREELIRENNILKTVDDINNSHLNQEITMPQSNALVETASIASMSSSNLTAGDYLSGSVQSTIGVDPDQGSFAVQNWTLEAVNSGISPSPASCDASVLNNRQQAYKHAAMTAHGLSTIDGTYVPGLYVNQHQFNLPGHDQGLLGNHLLQNTPFTVQDYSSPLLRPENWPNSRTQDLTSLSSAHQVTACTNANLAA